MKKSTFRFFAIGLMTAGLLLFIFPLYTGWETNQKQQALEKEWNSLNTLYQQSIGTPAVQAKQPDQKSLPESLAKKTALQHDLVGKLIIPKINLESIVVPGVTQQAMKNAVGWMTTTAYPGEKGNAVLAGHRSHIYGRFFHRLGEMKVGDPFYFETASQKLTYRIYRIEIVKPTDLSVLKADTEEEMTLITCQPLYSNKFRLIIKGKRIK